MIFLDKPMKIRLAFSGTCFLAMFGLLYLEEWIALWFPKLPNTGIFIMTALGGAYFCALTLPHPRQERKRREAEARREAHQWPIHRPETEEGETLAEKRP